jgi:hypothetical protein
MVCIIPAMVGLVYYKRMDKKFHPFVWMTCLTLLPEIATFPARMGSQIAKLTLMPIMHIYMLGNFYCFLLLMKRNQYVSPKKTNILLLSALAFCAFNIIAYGVTDKSLFQTLSIVTIIMLFLSIDILSKQIFETKGSLFQSFWFWFSSASILYNAITLLIFANYIFAMRGTPEGKTIGVIQALGNAFCQLLYAYTILKAVNKK